MPAGVEIRSIRQLESFNSVILGWCRMAAIVGLGLMVLVILVQVFFRYVLNNALPWPDEAARFCMLWMTGLMAPSAYRWGAFVSIDMLRDALGRHTAGLLNLFMLLLGVVVLFVALYFANKHIKSGWLFNSGSLRLPLQYVGGESVRIKLAWMYMSLPVGFGLMVLVSVELILKQLHELLDRTIDYGDPPDKMSAAVE